jgi:hypothetical protein
MNDLTTPDTLQRLAEWLERNGLDGAFVSMALVLLFLYFAKLVFKPTSESLLHEIKELLVEIKTLIMGKGDRK